MGLSLGRGWGDGWRPRWGHRESLRERRRPPFSRRKKNAFVVARFLAIGLLAGG